MHGSIADSGYYMRENFKVDAPYLTPAVVLASASAFNEGLTASASDEVVTARVNAAKKSVLMVILLRWDEFRAFSSANKLEWPVQSTKEGAFAEFAQIYAALHMTSIREGGCDIECFRKMVFP